MQRLILNLNHKYLGKATPSPQTTYSKAGQTAVFPLENNAFAASKDFFSLPFPGSQIIKCSRVHYETVHLLRS